MESPEERVRDSLQTLCVPPETALEKATAAPVRASDKVSFRCFLGTVDVNAGMEGAVM